MVIEGEEEVWAVVSSGYAVEAADMQDFEPHEKEKQSPTIRRISTTWLTTGSALAMEEKRIWAGAVVACILHAVQP